MTDYYFDPTNGSNANSGLTAALPKRDFGDADALASADDVIICIDGTHTLAVTDDIVFTQAITLKAQTYRGATLRPNGSESTRLFRSTTSLVTADSPIICDGLELDGGGSVTNLFQSQGDSTAPALLRFQNCVYKGNLTYMFNNAWQSQRQEHVNAKVEGNAQTRIFASGSAADDADQTLMWDGVELDVTFPAGAQRTVWDIAKNSSDNNTLEVGVKGVTGKVDLTGSGLTAYVGLFEGCDTGVYSNWNVDIVGESNQDNIFGIQVKGVNATATAAPQTISNNRISSVADEGYIIAYGDPSVDSFCDAGGSVSGNWVKGKYFAAQSPHGICLGRNTDAEATGNIITEVFAGLLLSRTTDADANGNLMFDCYGPSIYIKGATDATARGNVVVVSSKYLQDRQAIIAVNSQNGVDTVACTISENVVIVQDPSNISYLASRLQDQTATYSKNRHFMPDTVDLSTALLFNDGGTAKTLADWNLNAWADDEVILMPQAAIDSWVSRYAAIAMGGAGGGGSLSLSL